MQKTDAMIYLKDLYDLLDLDPATAPYSIPAEAQFSFRVSRSFALRMQKGDWYDPLLLQVLPRAEEERIVSGFCADAVGDGNAEVVPGLLHKYQSRALMMTTGECALHCRFCLRRSFPWRENTAQGARLLAVWQWLAHHQDIDELIMSGGDPLMLDNKEIHNILDHLDTLLHIRTVRIHTRIPIASPQRIDTGLLDMFCHIAQTRLLVIVVHVNHAQEISTEIEQVLCALRKTGAMLLSQSVLLAGVNDSVTVLKDLFVTLTRNGVVPYYLHQLDKVNGAAHFEVDEKRGAALMEDVRTQLSGYAVPRYVREEAGAHNKVVLR